MYANTIVQIEKYAIVNKRGILLQLVKKDYQ